MTEAAEPGDGEASGRGPAEGAADHRGNGAVVTDHGGGVQSIRVPIPDSPLGHTRVHVLDTDRGPVLIDTGWDDPASWDVLTSGLRAAGTAVEEVTGVVITHHHPDHHGLSGRVREASGAWLAMHPADTEIVRGSRRTSPADWYGYLTDRLGQAGAPEEHLARLRAAARPAPSGPPPPQYRAALPDREIVPDELLDLPGRRLRAIWTPGHTPGHVCLHLEENHPARLPGRGRLFSGDHLLPGISPHIGLYEELLGPADGGASHGAAGSDAGADPLGDYLRSLERVARLAPAEVLPAHEHTFTGAAGRVRELLDHHARRLRGLLVLLGEPLTVWETAERMEWNRPWERIPFDSRNIAVAEAAAHLRRLIRLGLVETVPGEPVRYAGMAV
ncbi:MBL fold metallo-hydrolase [Streptomyces clavuligerus]|uniref:MBL fold metallo-hydrolase n=1 Tax=Streptomyces clavuligerus TaxID=1901 RepID=UPI001E5A1EDB|nr:MBL fold metallo-hydrolase [Streptomyces clavuligerus]